MNTNEWRPVALPCKLVCYLVLELGLSIHLAFTLQETIPSITKALIFSNWIFEEICLIFTGNNWSKVREYFHAKGDLDQPFVSGYCFFYLRGQDSVTVFRNYDCLLAELSRVSSYQRTWDVNFQEDSLKFAAKYHPNQMIVSETTFQTSSPKASWLRDIKEHI